MKEQNNYPLNQSKKEYKKVFYAILGGIATFCTIMGISVLSIVNYAKNLNFPKYAWAIIILISAALSLIIFLQLLLLGKIKSINAGELPCYSSSIINNIDLKLGELRKISYSSEEVNVDMQEKLLEMHKGSSLRLICFGRKGFQKLPYFLKTHEHDIRIDNLEVIMCDPRSKVITKDDREDICSNINAMHQLGFTVYVTSKIPSIRAALIQNPDGEDVWCSFQSYKIQANEGEDGKDNYGVVRDNHYPICIEKKETNTIGNLVNSFKNEFSELLDPSVCSIVTPKVDQKDITQVELLVFVPLSSIKQNG